MAESTTTTATIKIKARIPEIDLRDLEARLDRLRNDGDRMKLLKASFDNHMFTSKEAANLIKWIQFGDGKVEACIAVYNSIVDQKDFETQLINVVLKYSDEKNRVKQALNIK